MNGILQMVFITYLAMGLSPAIEAGAVVQACCPMFWTLRGNRCYRYIGKSMTWHDAQNHCNGLDHMANLVSLGTEGEAKFVHHFFNEKSGGSYPHYWIGLQDVTKEGDYKWIGINRPMTYNNWYPNQPDNTGDSDCVEVTTKSGFWNDDRCQYQKQPFICERPRPSRPK